LEADDRRREAETGQGKSKQDHPGPYVVSQGKVSTSTRQSNDNEGEEKTVARMSNTPRIAKKQFCASGNAVNVHLCMRDRPFYKTTEHRASGK
jgi:chromatin remodeling complex protein RSC6